MTTKSQIILSELSADPTELPSAGNLGIYAKDSTEGIYIMNSSGTVVGPLGAGGGGGTPGGSDTQVQYNSSGSFAGDIGMTYNPSGSNFGSSIGTGPLLTVGDYSTSSAAFMAIAANSGGNGNGELDIVAGGTGFARIGLGEPGFGPNVLMTFTPSLQMMRFATSSGNNQTDFLFGYEDGDSRYLVKIQGSSATDGPVGQLILGHVGSGITIAEGSDAKQGTATMSSGYAIVPTTALTANSRIFLTVQSLGTVSVPTAIAVTSQTPGTGFTITSANAVDTSVVAWLITESI